MNNQFYEDLGIELADIPAGDFWMGSNMAHSSEGPMREKSVDAFRMMKHQVTVSQYLAAVEEGACCEPLWRAPYSVYHYQKKKYEFEENDEHFIKLGAALVSSNHPIVGISWDDARAFASWLTVKSGLKFRLPTETEWEYAARAGVANFFSTGRYITSDQANFDARETLHGSPVGEYRGTTTAVGSFTPNPWGLYDMHGNVFEWVYDCYWDSYTDKDGSSADYYERVIRGGCWHSPPYQVRSAYREKAYRTFQRNNIGFRLVQDL